MSWFGLVKLLVPIILQSKVPHGDALAPIVTEAINEAEAIKNASGKAKLDAVVTETVTAATAINAAYGRDKINIPNLQATIGDAVSAVITGANTVKDAKQVVTPNTSNTTTK